MIENSSSSMFNFSRLIKNPAFLFSVWMLVAIIFSVQGLVAFRYNNYLIFKNTAPHFFSQISLYHQYPSEYRDVNHYGPIFCLLMYPFSILPDSIGLVLWNMLNGCFYLGAISLLPISRNNKMLIGWLALPEFVGSVLSEQFNPSVAALIILSYVFIHRKKDEWAVLFILLGTFIKLYGIIGLAFFVFSKRKKAFIGYFMLWSVVLFFLPMPFTSFDYVLSCYQEWFNELVVKNGTNKLLTVTQDVSVMGLVRRSLADNSIPNLPFLAVAVGLLGTLILHVKKFDQLAFQLNMLALALITPVIFSTGSEDVTYIIAIAGAGLWYLHAQKNTWERILFIALMAVTLVPIVSLLPRDIRNQHLFVYAIKAAPYTFIWLTIIIRSHLSSTTYSQPA